MSVHVRKFSCKAVLRPTKVLLDDYPLNPARGALEDYLREQGVDLSVIRTDRLTTEYPPTPEVLKKDAERARKGINTYAYFQKPF